MDELKRKEEIIEELTKTIKLQNKMQKEVVEEKNENLVRLSLANKELLDEVKELKEENKVLKKELMNKHLNDMTSFLGKPIGFWIGWNKQVTELNLELVMSINAIYRLSLSQIERIVKSRTGSQVVDYFRIQEILNGAKRAERLEKSCHKCINSRMNGFELICVEWQRVIEDDECLCSRYEEEE